MIVLPDIIVSILTLGKDAITLSSNLMLISKSHSENETLINHEKIHQAQAKELGIFYLVTYLKEWVRAGFSYKKNRMEQEANFNEKNLQYLETRKPFNWKK